MIHHSIIGLGFGEYTFENRFSKFLKDNKITEDCIININKATGYYGLTYDVFWRDNN